MIKQLEILMNSELTELKALVLKNSKADYLTSIQV